MLFQLIIELFVFLFAMYYVTIVLHFLGLSIFVKTEVKTTSNETDAETSVSDDVKTKVTKNFEISFGKSLIPFYYWFVRETTI